MPEIIIKWKSKGYKTRSELEHILRNEEWGRSLTDEQLDKCEYAEKKLKEKTGMEKRIVTNELIDTVK